jgi:hypothetical protein
MAWYDYTLVQTLKALVEHTGATMVAAICFWLAGSVMKFVLPEGWIRVAIDKIEGVGLIVLIIWFFVQMLSQLYHASKGGSSGSHSIFVA